MTGFVGSERKHVKYGSGVGVGWGGVGWGGVVVVGVGVVGVKAPNCVLYPCADNPHYATDGCN